MQYDFNLAANGGMTLDVAGKFFKYKSGTGAIRVRASGGGYVDLLPGQGVWNVQFSSLQILDTSGGANKGVLLAGNFDFHDDRITGTVDVVDGGKARTFANMAFLGYSNGGQVVSNYTNNQLFNPYGNTRNIIVERINISTTVAQAAVLRIVNETIGIGANAASKKSGGANSSAFMQSNATPMPINGQVIYAMYFGNNSTITLPLSEPIILTPGTGLSVSSGNANGLDLPVTFEFFEEQI